MQPHRKDTPWCLSVGYPVRPACANHPDSPGRMRVLGSGRVCRNFRPRVPTPQGDVSQIPLGEGLVAYVDAADFEWLNQWTWRLMSGYAVRRRLGKRIYMHREIMQPPEGMVVDHLNRNKLDNTRVNLRVCTQRENVYNSEKRRGTASRFRGVGHYKDRDKWYARIKFEGKPIYLGIFADDPEAARAYDRAAVEYRGESACLNFPEEWPPDRRQQVFAQRDAVGATHASPTPGKDTSTGAGRRKMEGQEQKTDGAKGGKRSKPKRRMQDEARGSSSRGAHHQSSVERATAAKPKKEKRKK